MKRLSTGVLAALIMAGLGLNAVAAPTAPHGNTGNSAVAQTGGMTAAPPANFGSPPSGLVPILYNDHHVYTKPDLLTKGRVLAALIKGGTVLIPLRSMFEQMGATVSFNKATKTVTVRKAGAVVKVTLGKKRVIINGQSRPLDVPPMLYKGTIMVPVRVISEGMGAYVQWVPDQHVVVVRYITATPPPPPPPPPTPTTAPTAAPTATPAPAATPYQDTFIAGDWIISPRVYNEFNPGTPSSNTHNGPSYSVRGATEFNLGNLPWMLEGDYRQFSYPHSCPGTTGTAPACYVTGIGGNYFTSVPQFLVRDYDFDGRLGLKVANPRVYLGIGYMYRANNAGYPIMRGVGFGIEKLPNLSRQFSMYGSAWYYGNVRGTCSATVCGGGPYTLSYNILKVQLGAAYELGGTSPLFVDFGVLGDRGYAKTNAPSDFGEYGPYIGLGIKF